MKAGYWSYYYDTLTLTSNKVDYGKLWADMNNALVSYTTYAEYQYNVTRYLRDPSYGFITSAD